MEIGDLIVGRTYNRRKDLHQNFGGQMQGGISTPKNQAFVLAFTGSSGAKHGYADEWTANGVLKYFGEGQKGDMQITKGNRAIANQAVEGRDILLFETLKKKGLVRYMGPFNCAGYEWQDAPDQTGATRKAIVFHLVRSSEVEFKDSADKPEALQQDLEKMRQAAFAAAAPAKVATPKQSCREYFLRSRRVRSYVLARAEGICESCDQPAPFHTTTDTAYLEPHHIRRLTDGGPDDPRYMGAICPNCHREIHHGKNGAQRNSILQARITAKEATLD